MFSFVVVPVAAEVVVVSVWEELRFWVPQAVKRASERAIPAENAAIFFIFVPSRILNPDFSG